MRNPPVKLLDRVRQSIRLKGYSIRTEKTYASWIKRFILFHGRRHPNEMGKPEIEAKSEIYIAPDQQYPFTPIWNKKVAQTPSCKRSQVLHMCDQGDQL